jgi:hypothetical protein
MRIVLVALTVLLFLTAGTFGTLWFVQQGDHVKATEQLKDARKDVEDAKAKLAVADAATTNGIDPIRQTRSVCGQATASPVAVWWAAS